MHLRTIPSDLTPSRNCLYFEKKGAKKSALTIHHRKLASRAAVNEQKSAWTERLTALAAALS